jgi:hypothetical protein
MACNLLEDQKKFLYALYLLLKIAPLTPHGRYRAFEAAAGDMQPWHIEGISVKALEQLVSTRSAKGLRRAHRMARKERAVRIFDCDAAMERDDMLSYFYDNDVVTLVTAEENAEDGVTHWSTAIAVPAERLKGGSYSTYATKSDVVWAAEQLAVHLASHLDE